tara:strand:+ start:564 stop:1232 length:669 start_codon:yes stop_codon:yes gene_type:complete
MKNYDEKSEMSFEYFQPWSTFVMKTKLPDEILQAMLEITDNLIKDEKNSIQLSAKDGASVQTELVVPRKLLISEGLMDFFEHICKFYAIQAFSQSDPYNTKKNQDMNKWDIFVRSMWVVNQKDNEYNPVHHHTGSDISGAMYLKIPEYKQNPLTQNLDGSITFYGGSSDSIWSRDYFTLPPQVGDFLIFPSSQSHSVYPFKTEDGKGERRSVSFNSSLNNKE